MRIEQYDEVVYIALDPDGVWVRSEFPDEVVTVDYDAAGAAIGIEVAGSAAKGLAQRVLDLIPDTPGIENPEEVRTAVGV